MATEVKLPDGLLADANNYLDYTWQDPARDKKTSGILARGMTRLDDIAGQKLDYSYGTTARALLFDYARYVRDGASQDFEKDFSGELLSLYSKGVVAQHEAAEL